MAPAPPRLRILSGEPPLFRHQSQRRSLNAAFGHQFLSKALQLSFTSCPSPINEMKSELRRVCIVGGNAVSAFLSWRLQATNACDVTLVWKANYQQVAQYGISFK